jgi:hypothetical protein
MTDNELEELLRQWGALSKYTEARKEGASDFHALQRAREFAPGTRARAAMRLVGRDGHDRRKLMARELGACGVRLVPMDYVDPVKGSDSRKGGGVSSCPARDDTPPHLRPVAAAALHLYRVDTLKGLCLRQEYCGYGSQSDKADRVSLAMESPVGLRMYREALAHARGWMQARLTMQLSVAS